MRSTTQARRRQFKDRGAGSGISYQADRKGNESKRVSDDVPKVEVRAFALFHHLMFLQRRRM